MSERLRVVRGTSNEPGGGAKGRGPKAEENKVRGIGEFRDLSAGRMSVREETRGQRLSF